jgi:HAD superfamily hydrolase (TIGR01509 family)
MAQFPASQLQALIFDVDGTLAETERDGHRVAFNRAFAEAGLSWNWSVAEYGTLLEVAGGKERIQHYVKTRWPDFQPEGDLDTWAAMLHRSKTQHYQQILQAGIVRLRPGVCRLIAEARSCSVRLAIATTSAPENVLALLETALAPESPSWFEVIAAGDMVPAKKPAPDVYHYVLNAMQLSPLDCVAIEDSAQGCRAATQAGIPTVITVNEYTRQHSFAGSNLGLEQLGEPGAPAKVLWGQILSQGELSFDLHWAEAIRSAVVSQPATS